MKRKQRCIRILCMIFVLSLLLSACSKPPAPAERDTDEPSTVAGSNSGSNSTTEEQPQDTAADADAASEPNITLIYRNIFSEGIAWAGYYDSNDNTGNGHFGWLHPDGSIDHPFPIDRVSNCGSEFSDGYSYVTTGDGFIRHATNIPDSFIILDKTGAITAESPDDGSSYEILCGGNGVYLVKQSIRSMTESDDRYGLITADGDWLYECAICEPDGPHPLSRPESPAMPRRMFNSPTWVKTSSLQSMTHRIRSLFSITALQTRHTGSPVTIKFTEISPWDTSPLKSTEHYVSCRQNLSYSRSLWIHQNS